MLRDPDYRDARRAAARPPVAAAAGDDVAPSATKVATDELLARLRAGDAAGRARRWLSVIRGDKNPATPAALDTALRELAAAEHVDVAELAAAVDRVLAAHGSSLAAWRERLGSRRRAITTHSSGELHAPAGSSPADPPGPRPARGSGSSSAATASPRQLSLLPRSNTA